MALFVHRKGSAGCHAKRGYPRFCFVERPQVGSRSARSNLRYLRPLIDVILSLPPAKPGGQAKNLSAEMFHPECFGVQHDKRAADLELAHFLLAQERRKG